MKRKVTESGTSDDDDDVPLASSQNRTTAIPIPGAVAATTVPAASVVDKSKLKRSVKSKKKISPGSDSDDDVPLGTEPKSNGKANGKSKVPPKKRIKKEESGGNSVESDEETPKKEKPKKATKTNGTRAKGKVKKEESDDEPLATPKKRTKKELDSENESKPAKKKRSKSKKEESAEAEDSSTAKKKGRAKKEEAEDDEDVYKWWETGEDVNGDGSIKWNTLIHNGVFFPPPYDPLPKNVKMKYAGNVLFRLH